MTSRNRRLLSVFLTFLCVIVLIAASTANASASPSDDRGVLVKQPGVTVLTAEPLDFQTDSLTGLMNTTASKFATEFSTARPPVRIASNSNLSMKGLLAATAKMDEAIRATSGKKIVFGWSRGAQVASEWLRRYANAPGAPKADALTFVLIGNPQRRLGGLADGRTLDGQKLQPTPDSTRYRVIDVSRRYDGWANSDNWPGNPRDVVARTWLQTVGKWTIHSNYSKVSLTTPNQVRAVVGRTTYLIAP